MVAAMPLPAQQALAHGRKRTEQDLPPAPCPPACGRGTPLTAFASAQGTALPPEQQVLENPGDPGDYESLWYAPLRTCGVGTADLAYHKVHIAWRPDERKPHPGRSPRLYWRYPVWEEDGLPVTWRLVAVDGEHPRSTWDGTARPDLLYEPGGIVAGQPLVVAGDVLSTWVLCSLDIPACTFLCGPSAAPPVRALSQIAAGQPSCVLVVDNGSAALPRGPRAVASALRDRGLRTTYTRLAWPSPIWRPEDLTMVHLASRTRRSNQGTAEHAARLMQALTAMMRERTQ